MDNTKTIGQGDLVWCEDYSQDIIGYFEVSLGTDKYITIVTDYEKAGATPLILKWSKHGDAVWQVKRKTDWIYNNKVKGIYQMDYEEKWNSLKELLENEVVRLEEKEEYRQSDMIFTEGKLKQTQFILSEMEKLDE